MPDLTELAAEIERLDAGANASPWSVETPDDGSIHLEANVVWRSAFLRTFDHVAKVTHLNTDKGQANAALIALLRNNAATIARALRAASRVERVARLVAQQAEDEGLWFEAQTAPEAYLQQELRKLHAAVEGKL